MAERTIQTNIVVTGAEEATAAYKKLSAAIRAASEAKKEFDALFGNTSNSKDG